MLAEDELDDDDEDDDEDDTTYTFEFIKLPLVAAVLTCTTLCVLGTPPLVLLLPLLTLALTKFCLCCR